MPSMETMKESSITRIKMKNPKKVKLEISRFLCYILRHRPDTIGLKLDGEGWGNIELLLMGAYKEGRDISKELLLEIVNEDDKHRYQISADGLRIRAVQGHSDIDVTRTYPEVEPPEFLYHGTGIQNLKSIAEKGLIPKSRHHVHLSTDIQTAKEVGRRHGIATVLKLKAQHMHRIGYKFYQAENGVWLTAEVPSEFLIDVIDDVADIPKVPLTQFNLTNYKPTP
jgi:putative RNA 2'-phosphotransferase